MRKLFAIAVAAALLVGIAAVPALAAGQAAEKATGTVGGPERGWYAQFNAHEAKANRPAKGRMRMWSDEVYLPTGRNLLLDVKYVRVEGNTAWFAAQCNYDSAGKTVGKWLFVKVLDEGTPGSAGDYIGWDWNSGFNESHAASRVSSGTDSPGNWWAVTDGNLVVH